MEWEQPDPVPGAMYFLEWWVDETEVEYIAATGTRYSEDEFVPTGKGK